MNYSELLCLLEEEREICLFCIGPFGIGDGYLFLKNLLPPGKTIRSFCMETPVDGVPLPEELRPVPLEDLLARRGEVICAVMGLDEGGAVRSRLERQGLDTCALCRDDMFALCGEIPQRGDGVLMPRVEKFWRQRQYRVQIETTSFCNARCVFCPNSSLVRKKNVMSEEVFAKIIQRVKQEGMCVSTFILHINGEPLLDPHLFTRIRTLKREFPGSKVRFTTNFSLGTREVVEQIFDSGLDEIVCSLNSIDAEKYRETMGLDYETTIGNIENLLRRKEERGSGLDITLSIVAAEEDAGAVEEFKRRWDGVKVRVMKLGQWIDKEAPEKLYVHDRQGVCPAPYTTIHILSNGDYGFCSFDAEGIVGKNVMDASIREAWTSQVFSRVRKWHLQHGRTNQECIHCSF